jgi:hypothetical protein
MMGNRGVLNLYRVSRDDQGKHYAKVRRFNHLPEPVVNALCQLVLNDDAVRTDNDDRRRILGWTRIVDCDRMDMSLAGRRRDDCGAGAQQLRQHTDAFAQVRHALRP